MSDKTLIAAIKIVCFFIPFSLLIVATNFLFPYITGKAIYFRVLVEIAVFLTVLLVLNRKDLLPSFRFHSGQTKKDYLFWAALLLLFSLFLLLPFSVRPYLSFWGNAERMEGVWGMLHFFLWFFVLYFLFKADPNAKKTIFWAFVFVAFLINIQEIQDGFISKGDRPFSTLGNSTYIGFFNLLMILIGIYFWFVYKKDLLSKFIIYASMLVSFFALLISQTRGSIVGLAFGIIALIVYFIVIANKKIAAKAGLFALLLIVILISYLFLKTDFAFKIPGIGRVAQSIKQGKTMYMPRLISWGIFYDAFKTKPLAGFGLENAPNAYYTHFNPDMFKYEEVIFDRPHNKFLEILVTQGIVGLLFWLIFIIFAFYSLKFVQDRYLKGAILGIFVAYLVQNFTLFDMQASYLLFFFSLALTAQGSTYREGKIKSNYYAPVCSFTAILIILGLYITFNHYSIASQIIGNSKFVPEIAIDKYLALSDKAGPFLQEEAVILNNYVNQNMGKINKLDQLDKITTIYQKAYIKDPLDLRVANSYISFLMTSMKARMNQGLDYQKEKSETEKIFNSLLARYPNYPDIYLNYAVFLSITNEKEKALQVLDKGKDLFIKSNRLTQILLGLFESLNADKYSLSFVESMRQQADWELQGQDIHFVVLKVLLKNKQTEAAKSEIQNILKLNNSRETIEIINNTIRESKLPQLQIK